MHGDCRKMKGRQGVAGGQVEMKRKAAVKMRKLEGFCAGILLAAVLAGCGNGPAQETAGSQYGSDLEYIKEKGSLVVGVTDCEPLDYLQDGKWVGFDAEMAGLFAESLGLSAEFVEIYWDDKVKLLENGTIDCVWNGMTLTEEVREEMECSDAYLNNAQVVVALAEQADRMQTEEACMHLLFAVEAGSAGEQELKERNYRYSAVKSQMDALQRAADRRCDAAVLDAIMAGALTGPGKQFENLAAAVSLSSEEYGVGFRKGSDLAEEFAAFWQKSLEDGTVTAVAEKYGVQGAVIR